ncbi:hypothetical protein ROZALSC1DRAFT_24384, partial [Rozella allomycis CSF55]
IPTIFGSLFSSRAQKPGENLDLSEGCQGYEREKNNYYGILTVRNAENGFMEDICVSFTAYSTDDPDPRFEFSKCRSIRKSGQMPLDYSPSWIRSPEPTSGFCRISWYSPALMASIYTGFIFCALTPILFIAFLIQRHKKEKQRKREMEFNPHRTMNSTRHLIKVRASMYSTNTVKRVSRFGMIKSNSSQSLIRPDHR